MTHGHQYTAAEDKLILEAKWGDLPTVAERLGRSIKAINVRRKYLRLGSATQPMVYLKPKPPVPANLAVRLARPAWFDEDIAALASRRKMVGSPK